MACEKLFLRQLRQRGLRLTPQREMVLSALHEIQGAATAEEIHERVQRHSAAVDISTVYRTLDLLHSMGLVAAVEPGDGQTHFELLGLRAPHLHLACRACGCIVGVPLAEAHDLTEHLRAHYDFDPSLDDVTIPGLCGACRPLAKPA